MSFSLKRGVNIQGIRPEMVLAAQIVASVYERYGFPCVITSAIDGKHSATSLHYTGCAMDFRTRHVPSNKREQIKASIAADLSDDFDVILEYSHIHVEYQPGYRL